MRAIIILLFEQQDATGTHVRASDENLSSTRKKREEKRKLLRKQAANYCERVFAAAVSERGIIEHVNHASPGLWLP